MTHDDLATLIRAEVAASEPHHGLDPMAPVRLGRRRLRRRRLGVAGAAATLAVVAGVAVPAMIASDADGPAPASTTPTESARAVFERTTGPLGPARVNRAGDATTIAFGDLRAMYQVSSGEPADVSCSGAAARDYVSCEEEDGAVVRVLAVRVVGQVPAGGDYSLEVTARVPLDALAAINPADRFFRREVLVGGASASERVQAESADAATYVVPVADLRDLAEEAASTH